MPEIPKPYSHNMIVKVKQELYNAGFRGKKFYPGAKKVSETKYWWNAETLNMVGVGGTHSVTLPAGSFYVYTYSYPVYDNFAVNVVVYKTNDIDNFFDDSLDEKLGGNKETLGG